MSKMQWLQSRGMEKWYWKNFLNLFLDDLPVAQYLFPNIHVDTAGDVVVDFELRNTNSIERNIFELIFNHYTSLHLCKRFQENSDSVIIPVISAIKTGRATMTKPQMAESIRLSSRSNMNFFGSNYWKSLLEIALADNELFMDKVYEL